MKRAVLYARVSGDDTKNDGRNLTGQLDLCREYAERKGWQVIKELAEDERGASGASLDLPQLNLILEMARNKEFDVLVVREIDRLARDVGKQYLVEGQLKKANIKIAYALGEYPDTAEGELQKIIKAAIASYERTKISERSARGRRREANRGSVLTHGHPPYGYNVIKEDGRFQLIVNEEQARVVRMFFEWYVGPERLSIRALCRRMNKLGLPSPLGKLWGPGTVARFLKNETYAGIWRYGKQGANGSFNDPSQHILIEVPNIVDRVTWEAAQQRLKANKEQSKRNTKRQYLLRSRAKCGRCGRNMTLHGDRKHTYYICTQRAHPIVARCDASTYFRLDWVDEITWLWAQTLILDPNTLENGWNNYQNELQKHVKPIEQQLEILEEGIAKNESALSKILDLYLAEDFDKSMLIERKQRLEDLLSELYEQRDDRLTELNSEIVTYEQIQAIQAFLREISDGVVEVNETADFETKRQLIDLLNVEGTMWLEDGQRKLRLRCILGNDEFIVSQNTTALTPASSKTPSTGPHGAAF